MRCTYILHHPPEGLHILHVDFPGSLLCIHNDATTVVGVVPRIDQHVDLSAHSSDPANDMRVWRYAKISLQLVGNHPRHQTLVHFPPGCLTTHSTRSGFFQKAADTSGVILE